MTKGQCPCPRTYGAVFSSVCLPMAPTFRTGSRFLLRPPIFPTFGTQDQSDYWIFESHSAASDVLRELSETIEV